jgi:hypothetical protein
MKFRFGASHLVHPLAERQIATVWDENTRKPSTGFRLQSFMREAFLYAKLLTP